MNDAWFSESDFEHQRTNVRAHALLRELSQEASRDWLSSLGLNRFAERAYATRGPLPLLQPRGGFAQWGAQRQLVLALAQAGADFIPLTIDSHTRQNDYARAEELLRESNNVARSLLNGYPLLAHGATATRQLFEGIDRPVSLRHGTPDARLLVEAALDAGITEIEGGGLSYCLPYSRFYPIDRSLLHWQYVDRLCAYLSTQERTLHRESFGPLTATMVPPFMVVVVQVLELLMAAEQGVKSFAVSFGQTGSVVQDSALAGALRTVADQMLSWLGHSGTSVRLVYHQWMGAFPAQETLAEALIVQGTVTAALSGADKIVVKTRTEALGVPDVRSNADAVEMCRYVLGLMSGCEESRGAQVMEEEASIIDAATHVLSQILADERSPLWNRVARAVRSGMIDVPFSPHQENKGQLWTLRDQARCIRVADSGAVSLPRAFLQREKDALGNRFNDRSADRALADIMLMVPKNTEV